MRIFGRNIELVITGPNDGDDIDLDDEKLNIGFTVERNLDGDPNTAVCVIHNLSKSTQLALANCYTYNLGADKNKKFNTRAWKLEIKAGYDSPDTIFAGDIRFVRTRREPPNIVTEIEADDGGIASKRVVSRHFPAGVSVARVFKWLQEKSLLGAGNSASQILSITKPDGLPDRIKSGMTIKGYVLDEMSDIVKARGGRMSVQNGEIILLKPGEPLAGAREVKISPTTGLIGYPYVDNEGILTFTHRLVPDIRPGVPVTIESEFVNTTYVADRVMYSGSLFDNDFTVEVEGTLMDLS